MRGVGWQNGGPKLREAGLCAVSRHELNIARKTMRLSCVGALILGGPNHYGAAATIHRLTGVFVNIDAECTCRREGSAK